MLYFDRVNRKQRNEFHFSIVLCTVLNVFLMSVSMAQTTEVRASGAMRNVMMKGELDATIDLDTIQNKNHLFGLGPADRLQGEIVINDGRSYKSWVSADSSARVDETFHIRAPFFVYANVDRWQEYILPDSVQTITQLDTYLSKVSATRSRPFVFRMRVKLKNAEIHIVNLPTNTKISSPQDANLGRQDFTLQNVDAMLIGFFSTHHKGIFTHHDTNIHVHLITLDESKMGHLDSFKLSNGSVKLYLSQEN